MAVKNTSKNDELQIPKSTGAVKFDGDPVTTEQPADATSTGAVPHEPPGTTEISHYTEDVVVRAETPGPVTSTVSWLSDVETKVIDAPASEEPAAATTAETK